MARQPEDATLSERSALDLHLRLRMGSHTPKTALLGPERNRAAIDRG